MNTLKRFLLILEKQNDPYAYCAGTQKKEISYGLNCYN